MHFLKQDGDCFTAAQCLCIVAPLESRILRRFQNGAATRATQPTFAVELAPIAEPYADTEDQVKAGGTETNYVQKQVSKEVDGQQDLAIHLVELKQAEGDILDVAVVGCGPAGLAMAAELGRQGLSVGLIGRESPFVNTYGVWLDEFRALGLEHCLDHVWKDTILYTDSDTPIRTGRHYGRVDRGRLWAELALRCEHAGVRYLAASVVSIEDGDGESTVVTLAGNRVRARLVVVATGAASGKFLQYKGETSGVGVQTAYGIEVEMSSQYPYDPEAMLFMDYRDLPAASKDEQQQEGSFSHLPTFLYAMPTSPTRVFFEETCLAARPAMPFSILKERLARRLRSLRIQYHRVLEEEWSYIPVGGDLPDTSQQHLGFGAAASLIHPATGYSLARSLAEAPGYAAAIASALRANQPQNQRQLQEQRRAAGHVAPLEPFRSSTAARQAWSVLWSAERKRQRAFMIFGLELILQLDVVTTRDFFNAFFRLPPWLWRGFLASTLSSSELLLFAFMTFIVASNALRFRLVRHLVLDPSGAHMLRVYAGLAED